MVLYKPGNGALLWWRFQNINKYINSETRCKIGSAWPYARKCYWTPNLEKQEASSKNGHHPSQIPLPCLFHKPKVPISVRTSLEWVWSLFGSHLTAWNDHHRSQWRGTQSACIDESHSNCEGMPIELFVAHPIPVACSQNVREGPEDYRKAPSCIWDPSGTKVRRP